MRSFVQILTNFEIIRRAPSTIDAYNNLGLIYAQDLGDKNRALQFQFLAAHLAKYEMPLGVLTFIQHFFHIRDANQWRHVAEMSLELGNKPQALYCYSKLLRLEPNDETALFQRALMLKEQGSTKQAAKAFQVCDLILFPSLLLLMQHIIGSI